MVLLPMRALINKACRPFMRGIETGLVVIDREVDFDHLEPGRSTKYKTLKSGAFVLLYFGERTTRFLDLAETYGTPCLIRQRHRVVLLCFLTVKNHLLPRGVTPSSAEQLAGLKLTASRSHGRVIDSIEVNN